MASIKTYKTNKNNPNCLKNITKKKRVMHNIDENLSKDEKLRRQYKLWIGFFRANPHRFATDYLGVGLFWFQQILLYYMNRYDYFLFIAARGLGKSYLTAVFCCVRAILYPGSQIVIASSTKGQASLLIKSKIEKELQLKYPNLAREIKTIRTGINDSTVIFHNGSTITAVVANDNARGHRCNILVIDESRMVKTNILNSVLKQFLNVSRLPNFHSKPEYHDYPKEENKELYLTSAWYKSSDLYKQFNMYIKNMIKGEKYFVCDLPFTLAMEHGLLSEKRADDMRKDEGMSEAIWRMEMLGEFWGENANSFFKLEEINQCRTVLKPFYPPSTIEYMENKDKRKKTTKLAGEVRIIAVDVALMASDEKITNDATVFKCMRLLPQGEEYTRQLVYTETYAGSHTDKQATRLKQLFYDFEADYIAMDTAGNSLSLYDACCKVHFDEERDCEYDGFTAFNDERMSSRSLDRNAIPVIFSIKGNATLNHEMHMGVRTALQTKKLKLLVDEIEAKEYLIDKHDYAKKSTEEQVRMLVPYQQVTATINEMVNLEAEFRSGLVKLEEKGRARKDRYMALAMGNYLAKVLEKDLLKKKKKSKLSSFIAFN